MKVNLIDFIGDAAMLEQTAEECSELSKACLKMARLIRGENKVYKTKQELYDNLVEEAADVKICLDELIEGLLIFRNDFDNKVVDKQLRKTERLRKEGLI